MEDGKVVTSGTTPTGGRITAARTIGDLMGINLKVLGGEPEFLAAWGFMLSLNSAYGYAKAFKTGPLCF